MTENRGAPPSRVSVHADSAGIRVRNSRGQELQIAVGGVSEGFNPYELISAALGVCTSLGLRREAAQLRTAGRAGAVNAYRLQVEGFKSEDAPSRIDRVRLDVQIEGQLDDDARREIVERAVAACTVANTLRGTTLVEAHASGAARPQ